VPEVVGAEDCSVGVALDNAGLCLTRQPDQTAPPGSARPAVGAPAKSCTPPERFDVRLPPGRVLRAWGGLDGVELHGAILALDLESTPLPGLNPPLTIRATSFSQVPMWLSIADVSLSSR
jgi:hypothetical protein